MQPLPNLPESNNRIVIVGAGFAGLKLARQLANTDYQVVLIDRFNYHQFQPLFYQVATSGLEPSSISFPLRKAFQNRQNIFVRIAEVLEVHDQDNFLSTSIGEIHFNHLVLAMGADTNYFGNENIKKHAYPMKSVGEALGLRNALLSNYEKALLETDEQKKQALMNVVIVGGGPTGVELAGTLAEMKRMILPKDYHELDFERMSVYLFEAGPALLGAMSEASQKQAKQNLEHLGVQVHLNTAVKDFDGIQVSTQEGKTYYSTTLVWAAGIIGNQLKGLEKATLEKGGRYRVSEYNKVDGLTNVYALGDVAYMQTKNFPKGHPQVAQVAIQQAENLAKNFKKQLKKQAFSPFKYNDKGSMATIGRKRAVVDLPAFQFQGFLAWMVWLFIHLMAIVGVRNRLIIFMNWMWNYLTYDQSLRLIIKVKEK